MNERSTRKDLGSQTDWKKLSLINDADINYIDSPAATREFWANAQWVVPATTAHLSLNLDEEVVKFFRKSHPRDFQTKINEILKAHIFNLSRPRKPVLKHKPLRRPATTVTIHRK